MSSGSTTKNQVTGPAIYIYIYIYIYTQFNFLLICTCISTIIGSYLPDELSISIWTPLSIYQSPIIHTWLPMSVCFYLSFPICSYLSTCLSIYFVRLDLSIYRSQCVHTCLGSYLSLDLSVWQSISFFSNLSIYLSINPNRFPPIWLAIYRFQSGFIYLPLSFCINLSINVSIYPNWFIPVWLAIYLSISFCCNLSIYLSIPIGSPQSD